MSVIITMSHLPNDCCTVDPEMPHKCNFCNYASTQASNLKRHIINMHTENKPMQPKREYKKWIQCSKCDYSAVSVSKLRRHDIVHNKVKGVEKNSNKCLKCKYSTPLLSKLKKHEMTHTNRPIRPKREYKKVVQCLKCDYAATTVSKLRRHDMIHTGEMPHKCKMCGFACAQECNLKRHMETNHNENRIKVVEKNPNHCLRCKYKTSSLSKLVRHLITHNDIKEEIEKEEPIDKEEPN